MTYENWIDLIGWVGSVEVIIAYGLVSLQKVTARHTGYQILNGTGAIFLIVNTLYYGSYPSTFINIVWLVIASIALVQIFSDKYLKSPSQK